jgi:hypothetical protein
MENFDHWHNRQLRCRQGRGPLLDASNRPARHVDALNRLAAAAAGPAKSADRLGERHVASRRGTGPSVAPWV